ncbi:MAG: plasmid recombination protein, partial [Candidatus Igneacidithiobacillus chanchocoensis]
MSMTVSVRVAHLSPGKAKGQRYHDTRKRTPAYVEADRSHLNSEIITPPMEAELRKQCEERRAQRSLKRAMRTDAAIMTSGIITFGKDAQPVIEAMTPEEQDALFLKTAQVIAARWKTDLMSLTVHRDESAIHAHFGLMAVDREGQPLAKTLDTRKLQDMAGEIYQPVGITRGTPKAERLARGDKPAQVWHRTVAELQRDLPAEAAAKRQEIEAQSQEIAAKRQEIEARSQEIEAKRQEIEARSQEIEAKRLELQEQEAKAEKNRRLIEEQAAKLEAGRVTEEQAEGRISAYDRREKDAKAKVAALADEIAEKETKAEKMAQEVDSMEKRHTAITSVMSMIDGPCPVLPLPVTAKLSDGLLKAHTEQIYRPHDVQEFASAITAWAQGAATETLRQKHKNAIAQEAELQRRENTVTKREQAIGPREERMGQLESQNKKLLDERLSIGIHL